MADIFQDFPIKASPERVFNAISTSHGLSQWWTMRSAGVPTVGAEYELGFGPAYDWRARVTRSEAQHEFELEMVRADDDWRGTRIGFHLEGGPEKTFVRFHHTGWPAMNEHFRIPATVGPCI